ncbi:DUF1499 domain-containing protein [Antarcticimicrobium sediminis]|uniref:DUF1499 domain-containing protein n=1 Tax=Antarcticimicrobium sediminis TaxID=2546227 RepID=A0A4R5EKF1_9RHOB|nr:DUF1499 domain-containing protein [Antarcticimicrobium sediminis]TDE35089.1 DUF1499 domain-containing protein [Antarcticimicrobium sediminis]
MNVGLLGLVVVVVLVVAGLAFIRLAPSDPERWHRPLKVSADKTFKSGVTRRLPAGPEALARFDAIVRATPRTRVLAGSVGEGLITYVTRSRGMGFPDYTTVQQAGDVLEIYARSRFGRSDLGVNKARVEGWLADFAQIKAGG